ncbi:MAG: hypothetical protein Ct9H300mP14_15060 [Gammaproteobacteria bacterium]|nr:MAG: hypothetical protein Ct9H300mP14_15060 [Gammaproteobacteria bacterium]
MALFKPNSVTEQLVLAGAPSLFVVLWSTGYIGARLGLPYAEAATFLMMRFALAAHLWLRSSLLVERRCRQVFESGFTVPSLELWSTVYIYMADLLL